MKDITQLKKYIIEEKIDYFGYVLKSNSIHTPSALSVFEILYCLYTRVMEDDVDEFVLSKGHGCLPLYKLLYNKGKITKNDLDSYYLDNSLLRGLADVNTPGVNAIAGSLGHGLSIAAGWAYGKKLRKEKGNIYCTVGDGELNEGSVWEAIWFAIHQRLGNLTLILDSNKLQALGSVENILNLKPAEVFNNDGVNFIEIDGHNVEEILDAFSRRSEDKFNIVLANTVKGNSISFMENNNCWHYRKLSEEEYKIAIAELEEQLEGIL